LGQKSPFKLQEIWAIRTRLQLASKTRDLALFNLAIDSKLRGCDLVSLRLRDIYNCGELLTRATTIQRKTGRPIQFEILLQHVRIETAKTMIQQQGSPIAEISANLGYQNCTHFSRAFRKICGLTPNEYRNMSSPST
jgi:AraC-like DNA-binding protein